VLLPRGPVQIVRITLSGFAEPLSCDTLLQAPAWTPDKSTRFVFCSSDIVFIVSQYCRIIKCEIRCSIGKAIRESLRPDFGELARGTFYGSAIGFCLPTAQQQKSLQPKPAELIPRFRGRQSEFRGRVSEAGGGSSIKRDQPHLEAWFSGLHILSQ
jgi:hypothetical protein